MSATLEARTAAAPADVLEGLDRDGYAIVRGAAPAGVVRRLLADLEGAFAATPPSEGPFYGSGTVRFGRLLARSDEAARLVVDPLVFGVVERLLGRWHRQLHLSFTQAVAVHPGSPAQVPHRDEAMWPCAAEGAEHLVNVIWPLDPFTAGNGATLVWPGSHGPRRGSEPPADGPVRALMEPGDALVFVGSTLHAAGANSSRAVRRAIVFGYTPAWLTPSENPVLACPPAVAARLPRRVAEIAGYRRFAPNLNNLDCRCPSELLDGRVGVGAVDELHPEQFEALARLGHGVPPPRAAA